MKKYNKEELYEAEFVGSFGTRDELPDTAPEIAFMGRSNSGKSSLISSLIKNSSIIKTSSRPGSTATINFIKLGAMHLVDLPGFGYAKRSFAERNILSNMIAHYLSTSKQLKAGFLLLDCYRTPGPEELEIARRFQENHIPLWLLLSKADRLNQKEKSKIQKRAGEFSAGFFHVHFVSSQDKTGLVPLLNYIYSMGV